jgi:signal transduction histidine kinase
MRLSLKTKITIATSLLVLAVVATVSTLYVARLTRQVLREANDRAGFVAQQVFDACQSALRDAAERGETPASSSSEDLRAYVARAFDNSTTLNSLIESSIGYSKSIYEITISDHNGIVLVSSDAPLRSQKVPERPSVASLARSNFAQQIRTLYGPPQVYEYSYPFTLGSGPFGDIRIGLSSVLIRDEISPSLLSAGWYALGSVLLSTLLAALLSRFMLAPIERITRQLDRISKGEFEKLEPVQRGDEFGVVSTKIVDIGKQLRDVREIFSTLRENLDHVMSGLEDGLLLFNAEGRAVLISPAVEKFLGGRSEDLVGRFVGEIFPSGHPIRVALHIHENEIEPHDGVDVTLDGPAGPQRIGINAQAVREHGTDMGTLITLRDVESLERIGSQLEISERLAALGRVTAGVAHEVKNPLNSMRLWLEVIKGNMPVDPESQQAVKMLDSDIDRLDRAVKTFLNYTRPVELNLEEIELPQLLEEVVDAARPSITKAQLDLRVNFHPEVPPVRVDRQIMHQALLNLLLNACDFTAAGGRIELGLRRNGDHAVISVADTGRGIPIENQKKIFHLFFTTRAGGSGIGLPNTFRFVQLHNGRIEFTSEVGRGTTFRVELPLSRSSETPASKVRDFTQPLAEEKR